MSAQTLYNKLRNSHVVREEEDGTIPLYIDRHLVHEVISPQALEDLKMAGRKLWCIDSVVSTADYNTPTGDWDKGIQDPISRPQVDTLDKNIREFGALAYLPFMDKGQDIMHVMGPEQGIILPGMTVVCGDSYTSTHSAFGISVHSIGISEVEHTMATQRIIAKKSKSMLIFVEGRLKPGATAEDVVLYIIGQTGAAGGTDCAIEFGGGAIRNPSIGGRMTLYNMTIETGACSGMAAADQTTIGYMKGKPFIPGDGVWDKAVEYWHMLVLDKDATFDKEYYFKAEDVKPRVTWGTSSEMVLDVSGRVPNPAEETDPVKRSSMERVLEYTGLGVDTPLNEIPVDVVLIGSRTDSRIKDLCEAAIITRGRKKADSVQRVSIAPDFGLVRERAEKEDLGKILIDAGFEWCEPGCPMCPAMNTDRLTPGQRCASISNRNFEGRQDNSGHTRLVDSVMTTATTVTGRFTDIRTMA